MSWERRIPNISFIQNTDKTLNINELKYRINQPNIEIYIQDKWLSCLIDTGASSSIISCDQVPKNQLVVDRKQDNLYSVDMTPIRVMGRAKLDFKLKNGSDVNYTHTFFVVDMGEREKVLLGSDFLCKHGGILDFRHNLIRLEDENLSVPFQFHRNFDHIIENVTGSCDVKPVQPLGHEQTPSEEGSVMIEIPDYNKSELGQGRTAFEAFREAVNFVKSDVNLSKIVKNLQLHNLKNLSIDQLALIAQRAGIDLRLIYRNLNLAFFFKFKNRKTRKLVHILMDAEGLSFWFLRPSLNTIWVKSIYRKKPGFLSPSTSGGEHDNHLLCSTHKERDQKSIERQGASICAPPLTESAEAGKSGCTERGHNIPPPRDTQPGKSRSPRARTTPTPPPTFNNRTSARLAVDSTTDKHKLGFSIDGKSPQIGDELSIEQHNRLINLLRTYEGVFAKNGELAISNVPFQKIRLKDETPKVAKSFRRGPAEQDLMDKQIQRLWDAGLIRESSSQFSAPAFLVKKPKSNPTDEQKFRLLIDYRATNENILVEPVPTLPMDQILSEISGKQWIQHMDLESAYYQIGIHEESRHITAFSPGPGKFGHLEWTVCPQGLSASPSLYHKAIHHVLRDLRSPNIHYYLDDLILSNHKYDEAMVALEKVFKQLQKFNMRLSITKCKFFQAETKLLGKLVGRKGITLTQSARETILATQFPKNAKQLRSFLGTANFWRAHCPNFAKIAQPLTEATKGLTDKNAKIQATDKLIKTFDELKKLIAESRALRPWNDNLQPVLCCDASKTALGGFLAQRCEQSNRLYVVEFASRKLTESQGRGASSAILELMSLVFLLRKFKAFLFGKEIIVYTDHLSLRWLSRYSVDKVNIKLIMLASCVREHNLIIRHLSGSQNRLCDHISRWPSHDTQYLSESEIEPWWGLPEPLRYDEQRVADMDTDNERRKIEIITRSSNQDPQHMANFIANLHQDPFYIEISKILKGQKQSTRTLRNKAKRYELDTDGILWFLKKQKQGPVKKLLYIPHCQRTQIISNSHDREDSGHPSTFYNARNLESTYHWPGLRRDLRSYIKSCEICAKTRRLTGKKPDGHLQWIPPEKFPSESLVLDHFGPIQDSANSSKNSKRWILVVVDRLTRYTAYYVNKKVTSAEVIKSLKTHFSHYGPCKQIHTDNATCFRSGEMKQFLDDLRIKAVFGAPYSPQSQGLVERKMQNLADYLARYLDNHKGNLEELLQNAMLATNSLTNKSHGHTPFFAMHGRELRKVDEVPEQQTISNDERIKNVQALWKKLPHLLKVSYEKASSQYNKRRANPIYNRGNLVVVARRIGEGNRPLKICNKWSSPTPILKRLKRNRYLLMVDGKQKAVHISKMKPFFCRKNLPPDKV